MASMGSKVAVADGEVRTPTKTAWASTICGVFMAVFMIGFSIWNHLSPDIYGEWLLDPIAVIFAAVAVHTIVGTWTSRWRLLADRVETKGPFRERVLPRAKVAGYRLLPSKTIQLESVEGPRHGLSVPLFVVDNPAWAAWFETLENLDAVEFNKELAILEKDARLGATPARRLETLDSLRRLAGRVSLIGVALSLWLLFYPRPYDLAAAVNVCLPLLALAAATRWPGLVALIRDQEAEPTINLSTFWFLPSLALMARALLDFDLIDWIPLLCAAFGLAVVPFLFALRAERAARRPWMALFSAVILLCWSYGTLSLANYILDRAPPTIQRAVVVDRGGSADDDPTLSLRAIDAGANLPLIEDLDVSKARFNASPVGAVVCVAIYPGRLGWRYVESANCPAPVGH